MPHLEHHQPNQEQLLRQRAERVARDSAASLGVTNVWEMRNRGVTSWVYADGNVQYPEHSRVAVKLIRDQDPAAFLEATQRDVTMLQQLHARGAPTPRHVLPPSIKDEFIVTATEYLPYSLRTTSEDLRDYGHALATLGNVSEMTPDITAMANPFNPLADMHPLLDAMIEYQQETGIPTEFIDEVYVPRLLEGETAVEKIRALMQENEYPEVILQWDVTMQNARRDRNGRMIIIDLDHLMRGPAEYMLARPVGQWHANFGRPVAWGEAVREGFEAETSRPIDTDILELSLLVSKIYHATMSPVEQLVRSVKEGRQPDSWMIQESARRLTTVHSEDCRWLSQDEFIKSQQSRNA